MPSIRNLLCAALIAGVLFSAPSAEARFGKRSESSEKNDDSREHDASAVGDDDDDDNESKSSGGGSYSAPRRRSSGSFFVDLLFAILIDTRPSSQVVPSGNVESSAPASSPLSLRLGVDGSAMGQGAGLGAFLALEGEQWGVDGRALALVLPTDDGTPGTDSLTLTNLHLTVALVALQKARLRLEGGISSAHAPDITFVGPSVALTFEACIAGPLDLEMRVQATPYPYRQLDANGGLALHFNTLVLRGGWRGMFLDDNGLVDGVVHQDAFSGPYLGLGFTF